MAAAPAPGTGGAGKDKDGGKDRTDFENKRRGDNSGSPDRPPVYVPDDDGERGGYVNRVTPGGTVVPGQNTPAGAISVPMKHVRNPHNIHK